MDNINENVWYSGDWKQQNNSEAPYNGVQIKTKANYSPSTSPPIAQALVSVDVEVIDYTKAPKGVSSTVNLSEMDVWYDIPIPEDNEVSLPESSLDFTIKSISDCHPGKLLQLTTTAEHIYLQIQFSYGDVIFSNSEVGFIMKIDGNYI